MYCFSLVNIYAVWLSVMNGRQRNATNAQIWGKQNDSSYGGNCTARHFLNRTFEISGRWIFVQRSVPISVSSHFAWSSFCDDVVLVTVCHNYIYIYIYIYIVYSNIRWDLNLSPYLGTHILQRMRRIWHNLCISMWTKAGSKMFKNFDCQGCPRYWKLGTSLWSENWQFVGRGD